MKPKYTRFQDIPRFVTSGSYAVNMALENIPKQLEDWRREYNLDTNPDFQRAHVWTEKQQIAFMEFVLRGGRSGLTIYFNNPDWSCRNKGDYHDMVLVDGKQRLEAICRFVLGEIRVFGSFFKEYTDTIRLCSMNVVFNVNDLKTREEVLQWYLDLNSGGTVHTDEEIAKVRKLLAKEKKI